ncbi:MAG TPA: cytochrome c nitrite reductase small subunit [Tepidisphaeraceae bacterium]|nr:cytochrome c nitrite reductase small subunit [Tepidisphaeraceae bacterium]
MRLPLRKTTIALAAVLGIFIGVGLFTFNYAEGLSYFSTDPKACANCHIMNDEYASWSKAGHHPFAKCVDCHLPHEAVPKLIAKARNGWNHSSAFTLQNFHEPILITSRNAQILQDNCLRCHGDFVHDIVAGSTTAADAVKCVHCHATVGHGSRR